jgi:hypothetical protein
MRASARTPHVHADAGARPRGRARSTRTHPSVRTDGFLPRPRTVKPVRRINTDASGRLDDVRGRPDGNFHPETSIMTSLLYSLGMMGKCLNTLTMKFFRALSLYQG